MIVVVCPTPCGGHIEHAVNLAWAAARSDGSALVLSRKGSRDYVGDVADVEIRELFPDLSGLPLPHVLRSALALLLENLLVTMYLLTIPRRHVVVLEEPRFPLPCLLRRALPPLVLLAHNALNHAGSSSAWARLQDRLQTHMATRLSCVVHGLAQESSLRAAGAQRVSQVALPGDGAIERGARMQAKIPDELAPMHGEPFALCLGALRQNKGFHRAIEAANRTGCDLVVAGSPDDPTYASRLRRTAGHTVTMIARFLEPEEFAALLEQCSVLVLPYEGFSAQSGPLSRAMALGKRVIISDNAALTDQAASYTEVLIAPNGEPGSLETALRRAIGSARDAAPVCSDASQREESSWASVVRAVVLSV